MAKFFINGTPPRQTKSFVGQTTALKIEKLTDATGVASYTHKSPVVSTYMAIDPRVVRVYNTLDSSDISHALSLGYDFTNIQYNGSRAEVGLDLDYIVSYFESKDDTTSDNLVFGYPIRNTSTIEVSTSLMEAKFMTRKKNSDGNWATVIDSRTNATIFDSDEDQNEIKIFYMVHKIAGLPDTYLININGETVQIMEDITVTTGTHQVGPLYDNYSHHGIAQNLIGPIFIGANEYGNGLLSCPKHTFKIRPFATRELANIGIDTSTVTLAVKTNLAWQKLDNGDYEFTYKDENDKTPKFISLQIAQNSEIDFHESTRIAMNYTVHRE